jgi:diguanylate cyclase (GGDEF)-like protein
MVVDYHSLEPVALANFLERRRANPSLSLEFSLAENLVAVLRKASEFVPSEAGSILLDNPHEKQTNRRKNTLTFIAAFGEKADDLIGRQIPADKGIAGHVYLSGNSYSTSKTDNDQLFYPVYDQIGKSKISSVVAIPIRIEQDVCGVLELLNRKDHVVYSDRDLNLLQIFAGYISISVQNVLDGRQAQEIAKRDNLTGLYNDRYLHIALGQAVTTCRKEESDLSVMFIDLDYFKRVNDTHGHLAGSQVLREVGMMLADSAKDSNAIVARYGGDEFVLVAPGMAIEEAIDLAESIRERIVNGTFCNRAGEILPEPLFLTGLTGSIGIASLTQHSDSRDSTERCKSSLLRLADAAMYVAKDTGRNRSVVAGQQVRPRGIQV